MIKQKTYRVFIWGVSAIYNRHLLNLKYREDHGEIEVLGVYDRDICCGSKLDGYRLVRKEQIVETPHDFVIVMAKWTEKVITEEYLELGGKREKILPYRILDVPGLTLEQYETIRNAHFSIISSDCFGGMLSHTLNLPFLSPFVNLWIESGDYLKIAGDLKHYMSIAPRFVRFQEAMGPFDEKQYPVLKVGDVTLYCNHDRDPEEAIAKWERRKQRINYGALLLTSLVNDRDAEKKLKLYKGYTRKMIFTGYPDPEPDSIYLPSEGRQPLDQLHRSVTEPGSMFDLYSLFFGNVKYRRSMEG